MLFPPFDSVDWCVCCVCLLTPVVDFLSVRHPTTPMINPSGRFSHLCPLSSPPPLLSSLLLSSLSSILSLLCPLPASIFWLVVFFCRCLIVIIRRCRQQRLTPLLKKVSFVSLSECFFPFGVTYSQFLLSPALQSFPLLPLSSILYCHCPILVDCHHPSVVSSAVDTSPKRYVFLCRRTVFFSNSEPRTHHSCFRLLSSPFPFHTLHVIWSFVVIVLSLLIAVIVMPSLDTSCKRYFCTLFFAVLSCFLFHSRHGNLSHFSYVATDSISVWFFLHSRFFRAGQPN